MFFHAITSESVFFCLVAHEKRNITNTKVELNVFKKYFLVILFELNLVFQAVLWKFIRNAIDYTNIYIINEITKKKLEKKQY
jgi:hypothetical protein